MQRSSSRNGQQRLAFAPGHGGARPGAGRPRLALRKRVAHIVRPLVRAQHPLHVTVRMRQGLAGLRNFELAKALQRAFVHGCQKDGFRICQFSIQSNHVHLIVEAGDAERLARGMQGWSVSCAA